MSWYYRLGEVVKELNKDNNKKDATCVGTFKAHLIALSKRSKGMKKCNTKITNKDNLIRGITILVDFLNRIHWVDIMELLKSSDLINLVNDDLRKLLDGYASNNEEFDISDVLFKRLCKCFYGDFIKNYNKDLITSYERFEMILTVGNSTTFEKIALEHQDYLIKSLNENPNIWIREGWDCMRDIKNEIVLDLVYDNIPYNENVYAYINEKRTIYEKPYLAGFINKITHRNKIVLSINSFTSYYENVFTGMLSNYTYDNIYAVIFYAERDKKQSQKRCLMKTLIKDSFRMITRNAKNYVSQHQHEYAEKVWKLNFMRMFTYRTNLDIISIAEIVDYN